MIVAIEEWPWKINSMFLTLWRRLVQDNLAALILCPTLGRHSLPYLGAYRLTTSRSTDTWTCGGTHLPGANLGFSMGGAGGGGSCVCDHLWLGTFQPKHMSNQENWSGWRCRELVVTPFPDQSMPILNIAVFCENKELYETYLDMVYSG